MLEDHLELVEDNSERPNILTPTRTFLSICLNHDGSKIVSGCFDTTVRVWDAVTTTNTTNTTTTTTTKY